MLMAGAAAGVLFAALSAGLARAGLAFTVTHDGNHGSFDASSRPNQLAGHVLDLLGMSSWLWRWKHNVLHHPNPNIWEFDDDVDASPFLRLHPEQDWQFLHRWQHLYAWPLYCLMTARWTLYSDFKELFVGRIGSLALPAMAPIDVAVFWLGKLQYFGWALVAPAIVLGLESGLLFYVVLECTGGLVAAVAFQLAHSVEQAAHLSAEEAAELGWVQQQLSSTVDFEISSSPVQWYLGGLNHQVVHHLFPGISHVHYPWIAEVVRDEAMRAGLPYKKGRSLLSQLRSHARFLRTMGQRPPEVGIDVPSAVETAAA